MRVDGVARTEVDTSTFGNSLAGQNTFFNLIAPKKYEKLYCFDPYISHFVSTW